MCFFSFSINYPEAMAENMDSNASCSSGSRSGNYLQGVRSVVDNGRKAMQASYQARTTGIQS